MAEPIKFGGVQIQPNQVKEMKAVTKNGEKMYSVFLNNGTKIEYKEQNQKNGASVNTWDSSDYTEINNIAQGKIKGGNSITLSGCRDCDIDVSENKMPGYVHFQDSKETINGQKVIKKSGGNSVKLDSQDSTNLSDAGLRSERIVFEKK